MAHYLVVAHQTADSRNSSQPSKTWRSRAIRRSRCWYLRRRSITSAHGPRGSSCRRCDAGEASRGRTPCCGGRCRFDDGRRRKSSAGCAGCAAGRQLRRGPYLDLADPDVAVAADDPGPAAGASGQRADRTRRCPFPGLIRDRRLEIHHRASQGAGNSFDRLDLVGGQLPKESMSSAPTRATTS